MNSINLEDRLVEFSISILSISEKFPKNSFKSKHLSNQLVRSGTSVSLNYGEARAAESRKDFIHKMKIVLKELRETHICLKIASRAKIINKSKLVDSSMKENNELISIFVSSINTAQKASTNGS